MRKEFLVNKLKAYLERRTPPKNITGREGEEMTQAMKDEIASLFRAIDRLAPKDGYDDWWNRFEDAVLRNEKTRAWPIVGDLQRAAEAIKPKAGTNVSVDEPAQIYEMVVYWWRKFKDPHPAIARPHHADRMVKEGVATPIELHEAGFKGGPGWMDKVRACDTDTPHNQKVRAEIAAMGCKRMEVTQ